MRGILRVGARALLIAGMGIVIPVAQADFMAKGDNASLAAGYGAVIAQAGGGTSGHQRRHHTRHHRVTKTRTASNAQAATVVNKSTGNRPNANRQNANRNRKAAG